MSGIFLKDEAQSCNLSSQLLSKLLVETISNMKGAHLFHQVIHGKDKPPFLGEETGKLNILLGPP